MQVNSEPFPVTTSCLILNTTNFQSLHLSAHRDIFIYCQYLHGESYNMFIQSPVTHMLASIFCTADLDMPVVHAFEVARFFKNRVFFFSLKKTVKRELYYFPVLFLT